jgi:hypothetical protein
MKKTNSPYMGAASLFPRNLATIVGCSTGIQVPRLLPAFTALHTILAGISATPDRRL